MQKDLILQIEHSSVLKVLKQGVRSVGGLDERTAPKNA